MFGLTRSANAVRGRDAAHATIPVASPPTRQGGNSPRSRYRLAEQGWRPGQGRLDHAVTLNTIGIVTVAALAASAGAVPPVAMITATWRRTKSAAISGNRIILPFGPARIDHHVATLNIASFGDTLAECPHDLRACHWRTGDRDIRSPASSAAARAPRAAMPPLVQPSARNEIASSHCPASGSGSQPLSKQ